MVRLSNHWGTPDWIMEIFDGWYDPCPPFGDKDHRRDDLKGYWRHPRVYVNPPYSAPAPWVAKAIRTAQQGNKVVMLLKHDSSTQWYKQLVEARARFLMIEGRLNFKSLANEVEGSRNCAFPSVLAVLGGGERPIEPKIPTLGEYL